MSKAEKSVVPTLGKSRIISTIVSPALRLWLRSQVEHGEDLQVQVEGGDRQILSGNIPRVLISARNVIYQGLHLSQIYLKGTGIQINLGQVLRGKPLQLVEPVPVEVELILQEADLNASLQAPLLANALTEILVPLLQAGGSTTSIAGELKSQSISLHNPQIAIDTGQLTLNTGVVSASGSTAAILIRTGLQLENDHVLQLNCPQQLPHANAEQGLPLEGLENFKLDLGSDVALEELSLNPGQIVCRGQIMVVPA